MRNLDQYKGVIPAFYACYDQNGDISPEGVQALTRYFVDKGVKNSSMPVQDIQMFQQEAGEDYIVFNGPDEQFISGRVIGAGGGIGGTYGAMPELFLKMDEFVKSGELDRAREIQYAVNAIIYKMCSAHGSMYAVIKAILKKNEGLDLGGVRKPMPALTDSDAAIVDEAAGMIQEAKRKYL